VIAARSDVPPGLWVRNPASWLVGAAAGLALAAWAGRRANIAFVGLAPLGLAGTFAFPGPDGVHRWVDLGPLHVNAAQVLLPPALVACLRFGARGAWIGVTLLALLVAQPDASQATALAGALIVAAAAGRGPWIGRSSLAAIAFLAAVLAWLRPDPLAPVPEVEEIMRLAWAASPLLAVAAWTTLLGANAAFAWPPDARPAGLALAAYGLLAALAPVAGAFPVPLVGMAMSPIVGLWLGAGLLAANARVSAYNPAASGA
jgi:hypothetical protein